MRLLCWQAVIFPVLVFLRLRSLDLLKQILQAPWSWLRPHHDCPFGAAHKQLILTWVGYRTVILLRNVSSLSFLESGSWSPAVETGNDKKIQVWPCPVCKINLPAIRPFLSPSLWGRWVRRKRNSPKNSTPLHSSPSWTKRKRRAWSQIEINHASFHPLLLLAPPFQIWNMWSLFPLLHSVYLIFSCFFAASEQIGTRNKLGISLLLAAFQ